MYDGENCSNFFSKLINIYQAFYAKRKKAVSLSVLTQCIEVTDGLVVREGISRT